MLGDTGIVRGRGRLRDLGADREDLPGVRIDRTDRASNARRIVIEVRISRGRRTRGKRASPLRQGVARLTGSFIVDEDGAVVWSRRAIDRLDNGSDVRPRSGCRGGRIRGDVCKGTTDTKDRLDRRPAIT